MKEGWKIKTIGEVAKKVFAGGDVPKDNFSNAKTDKYQIPIFANGMKDKGLYGYTDIKKVTEPSITVSARGTIGYSEIREEPFYPIVRLIVITPNEDIVSLQFLWYVINGMDISNSGTSIPQLTVPMIKKYKLPVPPLAEQQQIVAMLDEAFAAIDTARANLARNIANAKELFQSKLNEIFSQKGEGWVEKKLGEVFDVRDGTHDSPKYHESGFPLITSKNLKDGEITFENVNFISEKDYNDINKRSKVDIGDVLFAMIGTIGNPVVITDEPEYAIKNVALFKTGNISTACYLKYYLDSPLIRKKMLSEAKGSTQRFVGLGYLRNFPILIPNVEERASIVSELDVLNEKNQQLIANYNLKLGSLDELKKSILQWAFAGEKTSESGFTGL